MKKTTKICALMLASLMVTGLAAACGDDPAGDLGSGATAGLSDVTLWGMPSSEKVYQNIDKDDEIYSAYKTEAKVDLTMAKGEKEGAHVIISADKKAAYDAKSSALTSGGNTISADNVEIFVEKYVNVAAVNETTRGLPIAKYPDAIVPIANHKKAGENYVEAGMNQGLYVRVNVPNGQAPGVYTGSIAVTIGSDETSIPVKVTVVDAEVPLENHAKSIFTVGWTWYKGELDTSQEILDKYYDALFDYRLNPGIIIDVSRSINFNEEWVDEFVEKAYTYMQDPRCSVVSIPYRVVNVGYPALDTGMVKTVLNAMIDKSIETNYNMFEKASYYFGSFMDEPDALGTLDIAAHGCEDYAAALKEVADAAAAKGVPEELVESIRKLPNVITSAYSEGIDYENTAFCPLFQYYDSEEQRALYDGDIERWFYGCVGPKSPYPTYHTDDISLSPRLVGWMQSEYDVVGNLFWGVDVYAAYSGSDAYQNIEEYYEGSAARYGSCNGDGYLFYPGKQYGIDGPVGSLRLEAIRDGLEEYELLETLKGSYAKIAGAVSADYAPDFQSLMRTLADQLYSGTKIWATTAEFTQSRNELLALASVNAATDFSVISYIDDGHGNITYKFVAAEDVVVKNHGATLNATATEGGYKVYEISLKLENASNTIALTFEKGGNTYEYTLNCGGEVSVLEGKDLDPAGFEKGNVTPTVSVDGTAMKVVIPGGAGLSEQSIALIGKNIASITSETSKAVLHINYAGNDNPTLTIMGRYKNSNAYRDIATAVLHQGDNEIVLNFSGVDWSRYGLLEKLGLAFYYDDPTNAPERTLSISEMIFYKK